MTTAESLVSGRVAQGERSRAGRPGEGASPDGSKKTGYQRTLLLADTVPP